MILLIDITQSEVRRMDHPTIAEIQRLEGLGFYTNFIVHLNDKNKDTMLFHVIRFAVKKRGRLINKIGISYVGNIEGGAWTDEASLDGLKPGCSGVFNRLDHLLFMTLWTLIDVTNRAAKDVTDPDTPITLNSTYQASNEERHGYG